ncbi:alpha-amylase family glycosyl hydrolase [Tautonia marina]|uniref:alpha-amylase family glycosyl hydrolase n=1 Tax=Tautonia marina TaxID=2653855 RepID=UPI0012608CCE|nr:alpha-amylase family glycosyl hydrolase [Tautonia marina]
MITVPFVYQTAIARNDLFRNPRLVGSWSNGRHSEDWSESPMQTRQGADGCPEFVASVPFHPDQVGRAFSWGVRADGPEGPDRWLIMTEVRDRASDHRVRSFRLESDSAEREQVDRLSVSRWLGAQKHLHNGSALLRFAVWAPNAQDVQVIFGKTWHKDDQQAASPTPLNPPGRANARSVPFIDIFGGYIADNEHGALEGHPALPMTRRPDGVWVSEVSPSEGPFFEDYDHRPYMFRVVRDDGSVVYRTDIHSRCQIGGGTFNPNGAPYHERPLILEGTRSCSVIVDPDTITREDQISTSPERIWPEQFVSADTFWNGLERPRRRDRLTYPGRVEDLVIYELHMGALGFGRIDPFSGQPAPGTLDDAVRLLDHLVDLGVNAVELLPLSEFGGGGANWGYATSHYYAIEYAGGGRDSFKHFIREAHRRGLAVIMDVVYNHYVHDANRAQWMYDTTRHDRNCYYWYEGGTGDDPAFDAAVAPDRRGQGGYVDNLSTGFAPRYYEELVRKTFISSAVALVEEFHIDGFRVDQTTSIHGYNVRHADGRRVDDANIFGAKLLREFGRTLKAIRPDIILMAEDHSEWDALTTSHDQGGMGFDARWYADFYHHLIGDTDKGSDYAKLLKVAGLGTNEPLAMGYFAGALAASGTKRVVYHESHDEAGNGHGTARTLTVAVNGAPLIGETRRWAERRARCVCGLAMLSAGTPMFLFGEEVGASKPFLYNAVLENREDLFALRDGPGAHLFAFYTDLIRLRLDPANPALRSRHINVLHSHDVNRVLAFHRASDGQEFLVIANLNDHPFEQGYAIEHGAISSGDWREVFNSDSQNYDGWNVGNFGATIPSPHGRFEAVLPAAGFVVFQKESP